MQYYHLTLLLNGVKLQVKWCLLFKVGDGDFYHFSVICSGNGYSEFPGDLPCKLVNARQFCLLLANVRYFQGTKDFCIT